MGEYVLGWRIIDIADSTLVLEFEALGAPPVEDVWTRAEAPVVGSIIH